MKRTFSCHFWLLFQSKSRLSLLMTFFESRISMKMKRTFSCNFGFAFTAKVKLSLLVVFESIKRIATVFKAKCVYRMLLPFGRFCTELACPCQLSCSQKNSYHLLKNASIVGELAGASQLRTKPP